MTDRFATLCACRDILACSLDGLWNGLADLSPAWKIPFIGKTGALGGFHRMDAAGIPIQHDALVIGFFDQRQALAVGSQAGELDEKLALGHAEMS